MRESRLSNHNNYYECCTVIIGCIPESYPEVSGLKGGI